MNNSGLEKLKELINEIESNDDKKTDVKSHPMINKYVIIRTYSAGVWCGYLDQKDGKEVILREARRMYYWHAKKSISLSACALYGIEDSDSKICAPVNHVWLEAIEIIPVTKESKNSLVQAKEVQEK